jgi:TolB-like protein/Tfp pilus assembly protein PilF
MKRVADWVAELKRRNVFRAAAFYAAWGWLLVEMLTQLSPVFDIQGWVVRWLVIGLLMGFPFAMLFSWLYEWTIDGIQREAGDAAARPVTLLTGKQLDHLIILALAIALALLLVNKFVLRPQSEFIADKSIAVLPFANESGRDGQYFSDGLSESLIAELSRSDGLKVISRNSAFQFRGSPLDSHQIGKKLRAAYLLQGSVRKEDALVRIVVELIRAGDGSALWSQHYDRAYTDLFALQDEIARDIADSLEAKLLKRAAGKGLDDRPPSGNVEAYNAFLQGKYYYERRTQAGYRSAVDYFHQALRLDQGYAAADAWLARAHNGLAAEILSGAEQAQEYQKARVAAEKALALAPSLSIAHSAYGELLFNADFNWQRAKSEYQRALQLSPEDGEAMFHLGMASATLGQPSQGVSLTRRALAADPLRARWYSQLGNYLGALGHQDEAWKSVQEAIALQPDANGYHQRLAIIALLRGDMPQAQAAADQENPGGWGETAQALVRQGGDDKRAADAALAVMVSKHAANSAYQIAEVYALRKDPDRMFEWLELAYTNRDAGLQYLLYDPFILRYQQDPRFAAFCQKIGLPASTEAIAMRG